MKKLTGFFVCVCCLVLINTPPQITAQSAADKADSSASKTEAKKTRRRPLPAYYGKIGISDEQRETLNKIRDEYSAKIEPLRDQIRQLIQERDAKMEEILTPGQKLRMKELREEARQRAAKRAQQNKTPNSRE